VATPRIFPPLESAPESLALLARKRAHCDNYIFNVYLIWVRPRSHNKLSFLTHKYELFSMNEGEDIQTMLERFQTILNELRSLGRHYDNYDHIDKI